MAVPELPDDGLRGIVKVPFLVVRPGRRFGRMLAERLIEREVVAAIEPGEEGARRRPFICRATVKHLGQAHGISVLLVGRVTIPTIKRNVGHRQTRERATRALTRHVSAEKKKEGKARWLARRRKVASVLRRR